MWVLVLALMAAVCWGLAPIAAKLALHQVSPSIGMGVRSVIAATMMTAWLLASGKYRAMPAVTGPAAAWLLVEALLATVVGDALYFYALKYGHPGQISLIMASSPLITLVIAALLLGEPLSALKVVGAVLIVGGLVLIGV
jgi:bacterial/archaeal transporter family protein